MEFEADLSNTCKYGDCINTRDGDCQFCGIHRCPGTTAKGARCKSSLNCKVPHKVTSTHKEEKVPEENTPYSQLVADLNASITEAKAKAAATDKKVADSPLAQAYINKEELPMTTTKPLYAIAFTGHRPPKLGGYAVNPLQIWVKYAMMHTVQRAIAKFGDTHEIVIVWGGALGVDQWAAKLANHLGLRHICVIPFEGFDNRWINSSREEFAALRATADASVATRLVGRRESETFNLTNMDGGTLIVRGEYSGGAYQDRNITMVQLCDSLIAVWDGSTGGTGNCVHYAESVSKPMVRIDPNTYSQEG